MLIRQGIVDGLALPAELHQLAALEDPQLMGDSGLAHIHQLGDVAYAQFCLQQGIQNFYPGTVSKNFKQLSQIIKYFILRQLAADLGVNSMTVSKAYQTLKAEGFIETDRRRGAIVRSGVQSGAQPDERFREKLEDELELLSAEAKIKGLGREEFIHLCSMAFAGMEG